MEYTKQCVGCGDIITYSAKYLYNRSIRENRTCRSCASKRSNLPRRIISFARKCPICGVKLEYSVYHSWWWANKRNQACMTCAHTGKKLSDVTKQKISLATCGNKNPMYGHKHTKNVKQFISLNNRGNKSKTGQLCSENVKMNMRNSAIARIKIQGTSRSYNPIACIYMDTLIPKLNLIHAKNSPDEYKFRGYFADGYDVKNNIWFEYDEPHHFKKDGTLKDKDVNRMNEIIKYLSCRFFRYDERNKILAEHFQDGTLKIMS